MREYYCPECGAVLNEQPGFDPDNGTWTCTECGQFLMDDDIFDGDSFSGVAWYCDDCGALLNRQSGFSDSYGTWMCTECGHINGITENDIIDEDEFVCPQCGSTLNNQSCFSKYSDDWECTSCGAKLHHGYSDDEYSVVEDENQLACPKCGANLEDQSGFGRYYDDWECTSCGAKLHHSYYGDEYSVVEEDEFHRCPACDAILEDQFCYTDYEEEWMCEECGAHLKHDYSDDPYTVVDDDEDAEPISGGSSNGYVNTSSSTKYEYTNKRNYSSTTNGYGANYRATEISDEEFERAFAPKRKTISEKKDNTTKIAIICVVITMLIPIIYFSKIKIDEINAKREGKINAGYYRDLVGEDYEYVVEHFRAAGFTYIELVDLDDSGILFWKADKVENISIGGNTSFESTDWFYPYTKVIISYH